MLPLLINNLKIRPEDRKEGTIGKETMSNIGTFVKDQYEKIPEDTREGFEQGVVDAATGIQSWNKQLREDNYWGGIGPLDPFIAAGNIYNTIAPPIKKEISIQTGLAPSVVETGEVALDFLTPGIPLGAKKAQKIIDEVFDRLPSGKVYAEGIERTGKTPKLTIEQKLAQRRSIFEGAAITNVEELDRTAAALVQRRGGTLSGAEFKKWNKEATADLQKTYKHITDGELNGHHNNIVKSGVSLHEGRTGPESSLIESWLINRGVASGDSPLNNNLIPEQVHGLVHKWLNERIGSKYLTELIGELNSPLRKRWESLPIDHPDVKRVVEQYADYVNGATERTAELMQAYYQIWGPQSKITEESLDLILKKLNITELEYSQLVKPGLSKKDAKAFAQGYGPKKIKVTWADGTTETMYEKLSREINDDPIFAAQLDELNAEQVKVGDFSNEPTSPTPAQLRRQGWAKEIEDLEYEKTVGKLSKAEKKRLEKLRNLMFYGEGLPLLRGLRYGGGPFKGYTKTLTRQTTKMKGTGRVEQKSLFDQISDIIDHKE